MTRVDRAGAEGVGMVEQPRSAHSAPGVGLLVAAATAPGTFSPSLSARSAIDQGIVTGLSAGLHHLLSATTQDLVETVAWALVDRAGGEAGPAETRRWTRTVLVDCAVIPVGLVV